MGDMIREWQRDSSMAAGGNGPWLSVATATALLGVSDARVRALLRDGALDGRWITGDVRDEKPWVVVLSSHSVSRYLAIHGEVSRPASAARGGATPGQAPPTRLRATLSPRERDVLDALATGASHAEIATQLGVRPTTVSTHLMRLYRRLGVSGPDVRVAAIAQARRFGLLP